MGCFFGIEWHHFSRGGWLTMLKEYFQFYFKFLENSFVIWSVQVVGNFDKNGPRGIRGHAQTMWTAMGGGGSWNVHFTNKAHLVKLSTKEGGGQYVQKMLHMVCAWSLRLIKEIGKKCVKLQEKRYLFFSIFNPPRSPFKEVIRQIICW